MNKAGTDFPLVLPGLLSPAALAEIGAVIGSSLTTLAAWFAMAAPLTFSGDTRQKEYKVALGVNEYLFDFAEQINAYPYTHWGSELEQTKEAYRSELIMMGMLDFNSPYC